MSSYELLSGRRQCGSSALAAVRRWQVAWRRCWQRGGGGGRAVAAWRPQLGGGSVAVVAVRRQHGGRQRGSGVGQCSSSAAAGSVAAVSAARGWPRWLHADGGRLGGCGGSLAVLQHQRRQQSRGSCAATARRHGGNEDTGGNSDGGGYYQQSTIN